MSYNNNKEVSIPTDIDDNEKIARSVFSPINLNKKGKLNANTYKSPAGIDEVSVNRLTYTTPNFCKKISKSIEQPQNRREYFGLAILDTSEIRKCKADILYSPIYLPTKSKNIYHSDIKVGHIKEKVKNGMQGEPLPAEIQYKIKQLTDNARFYKDPNPNDDNWTGDELI